MAITKEIKTLEDLRQRKEKLQKEIEVSKQLVQEDLSIGVSKRSLKRTLLTVGAAGVAAFFLRKMQKEKAKQETSRAFAQAFMHDNQSSWAGWLPVLRQAVDFAFDYLEQRFGAPPSATEAKEEAPE